MQGTDGERGPRWLKPESMRLPRPKKEKTLSDPKAVRSGSCNRKCSSPSPAHTGAHCMFHPALRHVAATVLWRIQRSMWAALVQGRGSVL